MIYWALSRRWCYTLHTSMTEHCQSSASGSGAYQRVCLSTTGRSLVRRSAGRCRISASPLKKVRTEPTLWCLLVQTRPGEVYPGLGLWSLPALPVGVPLQQLCFNCSHRKRRMAKQWETLRGEDYSYLNTKYWQPESQRDCESSF